MCKKAQKIFIFPYFHFLRTNQDGCTGGWKIKVKMESESWKGKVKEKVKHQEVRVAVLDLCLFKSCYITLREWKK